MTDIDGIEVDDHFMGTSFGSMLAGVCLMTGTPTEDEPEFVFSALNVDTFKFADRN